MVLFSSLSKIS